MPLYMLHTHTQTIYIYIYIYIYYKLYIYIYREREKEREQSLNYGKKGKVLVSLWKILIELTTMLVSDRNFEGFILSKQGVVVRIIDCRSCIIKESS